MPETDLRDAAPAASALRPTGPAAMETLPPRVMDPTLAKVLTAMASLRMKTKSVSSKPIWPPKPPPTVPIAVGADLGDASACCSCTRCTDCVLPAAICELRDNHARSESATAEEAGLQYSQDGETFGVGEDVRGNDFLGTEGLFGIDEFGEDATGLLALACDIGSALAQCDSIAGWKYVLAMEEGRGLLRSGMMAAVVESRCGGWRKRSRRRPC